MNPKTEKERAKVKEAFDRVMSISQKFHNEKKEFDKLSEDFYGIHYSDEDLDEIIDAFEYGGKLTFERFDQIMREALEDR